MIGFANAPAPLPGRDDREGERLRKENVDAAEGSSGMGDLVRFTADLGIARGVAIDDGPPIERRGVGPASPDTDGLEPALGVACMEDAGREGDLFPARVGLTDPVLGGS